MTGAEYHADPCPTPSLSASIAHVLLSQSPRHAWTAHPRLNPAYAPEESEAFDLGTAAHAYLLEGETGFVIVEAPDWRTKLAREARDLARAEGKTPLLAHRWADVQAMATAAREQLGSHPAPEPLGGGDPEQTLLWHEGDMWCRARLDWLHEDLRTIDDYKTTATSAHPAVWSRSLFASGYDIQAAMYLRGVKAVFGATAEFRFVVQETTPPYALSVIGLDPEALALGAAKVGRAIALWRECVTTNTWPAYPTRTCYAEAPPWAAAQWLERTYYEEVSV